jgi:hypothetical protein
VLSSGDFYRGNKKLFTRLLDGYPTLFTMVFGKYTYLSIHRLQAYQKYGDAIFDPNIEVRHKDGNPANNSIDNILIGTPHDNAMDKPKELRMKMGKIGASYLRRFTADEIIEIRRKKKEGKSLLELAKEYNTCKSTLSYIINKKTYSEIV